MINGIACFAYFNKIWGIPANPTRVDLAQSAVVNVARFD
jgi:hypothetical protein